jgi:hypothetical protein
MRLQLGGIVGGALLVAAPTVTTVFAQTDSPPDVEIAGVQTSADDARQPGEAEPFIINDGFGD